MVKAPEAKRNALMDEPNCPVLAAAVERDDTTGQPVTAASIATALLQSESVAAARL